MAKLVLILIMFVCITSCASFESVVRSTGRIEYGQSICSGVYVSPNLFLTAEHCFDGEVPSKVVIAGEHRKVLAISFDKTDHALLLVDKPSKYYSPVSKYKPRPSDKIFYVGNPAGIDQLYRQGYVVGISDGDILLDVRGWKGDSGAGIFNSSGYLIGTMNYYLSPPEPGNLFYLMGAQPWTFDEVGMGRLNTSCNLIPICTK